MQFLIVATHTADNCPAYASEEIRVAMGASAHSLPQRAQELGLQVHFMVSTAPGHSIYALVETDNLAAIQQVMHSMPIRQDWQIIPVQPLVTVTDAFQPPSRGAAGYGE